MKVLKGLWEDEAPPRTFPDLVITASKSCFGKLLWVYGVSFDCRIKLKGNYGASVFQDESSVCTV